MTENYTIPTNAGLAWNAAAAAGLEVSPITQIAFGDGDRVPAGGETALDNEVYRLDVIDHGVYPDQTAAWFEVYLDETIGGFVTKEHGLFLSDGTMVAIGYRAQPIPVVVNDAFRYRIDVFYSRLDALIVEIEPILTLTPNRKIQTETGLAGGGDLTSDRTLITDWSNLVPLSAQISGTATLNMRQGGDQITISMAGLLAWVRGLLDNDGDDLTHDFVTFNDQATNDDYGIVRLADLAESFERLTHSELFNFDAGNDQKLLAQSTIKNMIKVTDQPFTGFGYLAGQNNTGQWTSAFGEYALANNTGSGAVGFGRSALQENSGSSCVGFGSSTLQHNTGGWVTGVGGSALAYNTANFSTGIGRLALIYNNGASSMAVGDSALAYNSGTMASALGTFSLNYNSSHYVTALGGLAGNVFVAGPQKSVTAVSGGYLTIPAHGFGADNNAVIIRVEAADTLPAGVGLGSYRNAIIVDQNTLDISPSEFPTAGTNVLVSCQTADFTNSTMLGYNSQASGPNEVRLGDTNVQHVRTDGSFRTSKGVQSGTYQFNALPAPATMGKGARIWTDANMMLVSTGLKWMPVGQQIWAAHDRKTVFGFASVSIAIVGAEQIKSYVFSVPTPNASYIIQFPSMLNPLEVVEQTVTGFKLPIGADTSAWANNPNILVIWTGREVVHVPPDNLNIYVPPPSGGGGYVGSPPDTEGFGGNDP